MATSTLIKPDYDLMWRTMIIRPERVNEVNAVVKRILANKKRYENLINIIKVPYPHSLIPWYFVAVVHKMEANLGFAYHLHNGDPLTKRTVQVPKGRPAKGFPPFTWEQSAFDALCNVAGLHKVTDWSISALLYRLEGYNGYGYQKYHPEVNTPYLWSYSNFYGTFPSIGKYLSDGKFQKYDKDGKPIISNQMGCAVILKQLIQ